MIHTDNNNRIDTERFQYALSLYNASKSHNNRAEPGSIGTLGEKSLHAVLKLYYEPDSSRHELPVGEHIADIVGEEGVIEIQTRRLSALKNKLKSLLEICRVTVVHPIITGKRIISVSGETGEVISVRKSPKHGTLYTEMREIYALREHLTEENLTLKLPLLTANEYRTYGVRTNRRKKQRTKRGEYISDIIPTDIIDEITLAQSSDYAILMPQGLPDAFGVRTFAEAAGTDEPSARMAINLLVRTGHLLHCGKEGNARIYSPT